MITGTMRISILALPVLLLFAGQVAAGAERATSEWVSVGPEGKLVYKTTERGDRIMDFSHAGYMGGGVAIPDVAVKKTVKPSGPDDTAAIQSAIDEVAKLPLDERGFRGAVLLAAGTFSCAKTITIGASGVVLRGSSVDSSIIKLTGQPHLGIAVRGEREAGGEQRDGGEPKAPQAKITDAYIPSGASSFTVADASGFKVGDAIVIRRPVTEAWARFMHMDDLTRDGRPQTWIKPGGATLTERNIAAINGNRMTLDVPLSDSFDAKYLSLPGATIAKASTANRVTQCGVENLRIVSPPQAISHTEDHFSALRINGQDCWARNVVAEETMNSIAVGGRRITLHNVAVIRKAKHQGASKPAEFAPNGTQVLMDRCRVEADNVWFVATGAGVAGPMVVLNCTFSGGGRAESHQRWSTAILYDNVRAPGGGIELRNRGAMGSGHGWTMGWGVVWNCVTGHYIVQNPPGAVNWVIGSIGENEIAPRPFGSGPALPGATIDSSGAPVAPASLYLAQLKQRLGEPALKNIGYDSPHIGEPTTGDHAEGEKRANAKGPLGPDLAIDCPVTTSNFGKMDVRFAGWNALDGDDNTYWRANPADLPARLEFDTEGAVQINTIELGEALDHLDSVQSYKLEAFIDSAWKVLAEGTTVGRSRVHRFAPTTVWKIRLTIDKASDYAAIRKIAIYFDRAAS